MMKQRNKTITEDMYAFLTILAENSRGYLKRDNDTKNNIIRSERELAKIFGKERIESLIDLGFEQGYIRRERVDGIPGEEGLENAFLVPRIQLKGLKYLEEFEKEKRKEIKSKSIVLANWLLLVATFGLLISALITQNVANKSFESENRPYIYVGEISLKNFDENSSSYEIKSFNFGNFPGRVIDVKTNPENGQKYTLNYFSRTTVLNEGESLPLEINEFAMGNEFNMPFTISYSGVGELADKIYAYSFTVTVNKEDKQIQIKEGKI